MKYLAIIAICTIGVWGLMSEEQEQVWHQLTEACINETHVSEEILQNARNGVFSEHKEFREFLVCAYKRLGFLNEQGELDRAVISSKVSKILGNEMTTKMMQECVADFNEDAESNSLHLLKCVFKYASKIMVDDYEEIDLFLI